MRSSDRSIFADWRLWFLFLIGVNFIGFYVVRFFERFSISPFAPLTVFLLLQTLLVSWLVAEKLADLTNATSRLERAADDIETVKALTKQGNDQIKDVYESFVRFTSRGTVTEILEDKHALFMRYNSLIRPNSKLYLTLFSTPAIESNRIESERQYWEMLRRYLASSDDFLVERIVSIEDSSKLKWVERLIEDNKNFRRDHLKYRRAQPGYSRINVNIIDNGDKKYVIIHPSHGYVKGGAAYLFIENNAIAEYWKSYFSVAWSQCEFLKDGLDIEPMTRERPKIEAYLEQARQEQGRLVG